MAGEGIKIGTGQGVGYIEPKGTILGTAGNVNCRPTRQNKLKRRKGDGNILTLPKIKTVKFGQ